MKRLLLFSETDIDFLPDQLPDLALWHQIDETTVTKNISDEISQIIDLGPNLINVTQSTTNLKPLFVANGLNGQPTARCDGTKLMTGAGISLLPANGLTIFLVATRATLPSFCAAFGLGTGFVYGSRFSSFLFSSTGLKDYVTTDSTLWQLNVPLLFEIQYDPNFDVSFFKNGVFIEKISHTAGFTTTSAQTIFAAKLGPAIQWNGDISSNIIYSRILSSQEKTQVRTYLNNIYNLF